MSDTDGIYMRNLMIFALAVVIVGMAVIPSEVTDAETYPSELAELQYWDGINATVIYVFPNNPIGGDKIPPLPTGCTYWVRMDTGEVVTAETVFEPGSYYISPYSWKPQPWGPSEEPSPGASDNALVLAAIALSSVAIIIGAVAIAVAIRKK